MTLDGHFIPGRTHFSGIMFDRIRPRRPLERPRGVADLRKQADMRTVPLRGKRAAGRVALVDDEDYGLVMQYGWFVQEDTTPGRASGPYARTDLPGKIPLFMHNLVAGYLKPDHIDGNGLNNQRSNLRPATAAQNSRNRRKHSGTSSRYMGVSWHKAQRKWFARIGYEGTMRYLGYYLSEEEAALAYDAAARELFGEYARPNFPKSPERSGTPS